MTKKNELTIIPSEVTELVEIETNISTINAPLEQFLGHVGLPTQNLLSPVDERRKVVQAIESVLEILPVEERLKATYIAKFTICVAVGLFDGALAFLWDETIKALRAKVINFDLEYFYSIASSMSGRYKGLKDSTQITAVSEHDLLEICRRIGLINDVNHRRLDNVNYFRNHASAAHPNEVELSGVELLGFLESCLKYAICAPIEHSVVQVKRLLDNVRHYSIGPLDYPAINTEVSKLEQQRVEDILHAMFGMFCDPGIGQHTLTNIKGLAPGIWGLVSEDFKHKVGSRYGYYRANGDVPKRDRTQEFLSEVDGNQYKDEDSLGAELLEKLQNLRSAHYGTNNFYNESPHAKAIAVSLPRTAGIPQSARHDFIKVISTCYIGNGHGYKQGVDEAAVPYYQDFITRFDDDDIVIYLQLFRDHEFTGDLERKKASDRAIELCKVLIAMTKDQLLKKALDVVIHCPSIANVAKTSEYKRSMTGIEQRS
jgi:hypothetical protein